MGSVGLLGMLFGALLGGGSPTGSAGRRWWGIASSSPGWEASSPPSPQAFLGFSSSASSRGLGWERSFPWRQASWGVQSQGPPGADGGPPRAFWAVGWLLAALVGYLLVPSLGWRAAFLAGALPALYAAYLRLSLPSPPAGSWPGAGRRRRRPWWPHGKGPFPGPLPEPRPEPAPRPSPTGPSSARPSSGAPSSSPSPGSP